jgi:hypothetical protein
MPTEVFGNENYTLGHDTGLRNGLLADANCIVSA